MSTTRRIGEDWTDYVVRDQQQRHNVAVAKAEDRGYRDGLLKASRMASARAATERCRKKGCESAHGQFLRLANDLRKLAKGDS